MRIANSSHVENARSLAICRLRAMFISLAEAKTAW